jgi:hypothetical protein
LCLRLFRGGLEVGEAVGNGFAVLVACVVVQADRLAVNDRAVGPHRGDRVIGYSRILASGAQKGGLADGALDVEGLLVGLELRLGRAGLVLGIALTLLRGLGTLLSRERRVSCLGASPSSCQEALRWGLRETKKKRKRKKRKRTLPPPILIDVKRGRKNERVGVEDKSRRGRKGRYLALWSQGCGCREDERWLLKSNFFFLFSFSLFFPFSSGARGRSAAYKYES